MEKPDENRSVWRRLIESHVPLLVTAAMFTFLVLKVLSAANGEPETALAVLTAVGVAQIVMGVIVSSYGLFMFVLLSWAVYWGVSATCEEEPNGEHTIWPPLALAVAAGLAILFLDSILLGLVAIILSVGVVLAGSRVARRLDTAQRRIVRVVFLGVVLLVSLAFMSLGGLWLPTEMLTIDDRDPDASKTLVGYVLNNSDGWTSVLSETDRLVVKVRSSAVTAREVCTERRGKVFGPSVIELLGHDSTPVPRCADLPASRSLTSSSTMPTPRRILSTSRLSKEAVAAVGLRQGRVCPASTSADATADLQRAEVRRDRGGFSSPLGEQPCRVQSDVAWESFDSASPNVPRHIRQIKTRVNRIATWRIDWLQVAEVFRSTSPASGWRWCDRDLAVAPRRACQADAGSLPLRSLHSLVPPRAQE